MKIQSSTIEWLDVAKLAAREAGQFLSRRLNGSVQIEKSIGKDIKLKEDIASEKIILEILKSKSKFPILSEEGGWIGAGQSKEFFWAVDPIDGTMNFSRGLPLSCVSIGLWNGSEPILGVIYDFNRDELFSGIASESAWLNDQPIRVSETKSINQSILSTGFPLQIEFTEANINKLVKSILAYKKIRMIGSAALSLAYVACGRVDAYYEHDIMLWDIAGGLPIILAAGGQVQKTPKKKIPFSFDIYASNGLLKR